MDDRYKEEYPHREVSAVKILRRFSVCFLFASEGMMGEAGPAEESSGESHRGFGYWCAHLIGAAGRIWIATLMIETSYPLWPLASPSFIFHWECGFVLSNHFNLTKDKFGIYL